MGKPFLLVSSVTYAMKGRDLLSSRGFRAFVERIPRTGDTGCGYGIYVPQGTEEALRVLEENGIRVVKTAGSGGEDHDLSGQQRHHLAQAGPGPGPPPPRGLSDLGANPGRGGYPASAQAAWEVYQCRKKAAALLGARGPEHVSFQPSCTQALNLVLSSQLQKGGPRGGLRPGTQRGDAATSCAGPPSGGVTWTAAKTVPGDNDATLEQFRQAMGPPHQTGGVHRGLQRVWDQAPRGPAGGSVPPVRGEALRGRRPDRGPGPHERGGRGPGLPVLRRPQRAVRPHGGWGSSSCGTWKSPSPPCSGAAPGPSPAAWPSRRPPPSGTRAAPSTSRGFWASPPGWTLSAARGPSPSAAGSSPCCGSCTASCKPSPGRSSTPQSRTPAWAVPVLAFNLEGLPSEETGRLLAQAWASPCGAACTAPPLAHEKMGTAQQGAVRVSPSAFTKPWELESLAPGRPAASPP